MSYLDTGDHLTVWKLAHDWAGIDSAASNPDSLPPEIKAGIFRVLVAIRNKLLSVRTPSRAILVEDGFLDMLADFPHDLKFNACLKKDRFDKNYLDSLYVWRPEVIRWCVNDQLLVPSIWQPKPESGSPDESSDDEHWYECLTDRRKGIVAALHIADRLWKEDRSLTYEEIWNHPDMKRYDKPRIFPSLDSFKEWARDIAPKEVKSPGRRRKSV
jgi:hypothetical protein